MSISPTMRRVGASLIKDLTIAIGKSKSRILPMVVQIAASEWRKAGSQVDYQDAVEEAVLGALVADSRYKRGRGTKFSTYAYTRIQGAVKDYIRREAVNSHKHVLCDPKDLLRVPGPDGMETRVALEQQFKTAVEVIQRELRPEHSAILVLFYLRGQSETKIAKKLRSSAGQVSKTKKVALSQAKVAMNKRGHYAVVE